MAGASAIFRLPAAEHDNTYASYQVYAEAEQGWLSVDCGAERGARISDS
jgi:hypothetical protein